MFQYQDYCWLETPEALKHWDALVDDSSGLKDPSHKRLRSELTTEQATLLLEQWELFKIAKRKFSDPSRWFWTRQLLEQSSDEVTAAESARDFPMGVPVQDVCCGAGADSIALAKRQLIVEASDKCPIACTLARRNAHSHGQKIRVTNKPAEHMEFDREQFVHIDPDRRSHGQRTTRLESMSPSWETLQKIRDTCSGVSLKLAPGLREDLGKMNREDGVAPQAIRFLSKDGQVRQQRWYWRMDRWPRDHITVSMFLNGPALRRVAQFQLYESDSMVHTTQIEHGWMHESFPILSNNHADMNPPVLQEVKKFIADYDPSIRASQLGPQFANRYGWHLVGAESGYLTDDQAINHPMVRCFQVVENLPLDCKKIRVFARSADASCWELKSRNVDVDLDQMRKIMHTNPSSALQLSVLFTKIGTSHRAIIAREVAL
jgi:THUMP domain-like